MALFTISDLHLSFGVEKPMDVFEGWEHYEERLAANWQRLVKPEDTVVIPGDISWGMTLEQAKADFSFIDALPGRKIIGKGNHDFWWSTKKKLDEWLSDCGFSSICFLFNNSYEAEGLAVCGTRGWLSETDSADDERVLAREAGRLRMSLQSAKNKTGEPMAFLHYPPVYANFTMERMTGVLKEFGVGRCFYGHMHGASANYAVNREVDGIAYKLISADALRFCPYRII